MHHDIIQTIDMKYHNKFGTATTTKSPKKKLEATRCVCNNNQEAKRNKTKAPSIIFICLYVPPA